MAKVKTIKGITFNTKIENVYKMHKYNKDRAELEEAEGLDLIKSQQMMIDFIKEIATNPDKAEELDAEEISEVSQKMELYLLGLNKQQVDDTYKAMMTESIEGLAQESEG